jgi:DNA repair exonuclease SbcCD ATPase subunit
MKSKLILTAASVLALASFAVVPLYAQTTSTSTSTASTTPKQTKLDQKILKARGKSDKEIDRRVADLNKLITRIQDFRNVPDAQKTGIITTIQSLIASLNTLKNEINTTESTTTLKTDMESITKAYRVYALAIPQLHIVAQADRVLTLVDMMSAVGIKIQARMAQEPTVASQAVLSTALTDMGAKLSDAKLQAQAAFNDVSPLVPDLGDKTKMQSNITTLKDARTKLQAAQKDLKAARKDIQTIIQAIVKADKALGNMGNGKGNGGAATSTGTTTP